VSSRVAVCSAAVTGSAPTPDRSPRVIDSASSPPPFVGWAAASAERRRSWAAIAALTAADSSPAVA
jgi:hypothetical protein